MNAGLAALAQGGKAFLESYGGVHGSAMAENTWGKGFETPWGKGPFWNADTITALQGRQFHKTMDLAKSYGLHPLFALGNSGNFSPTVGGEPRGPSRPGGGMPGTPSPARASALQERAIKAGIALKEAEAMYWNAKAAKEAQAPGGTPTAGLEAGAGEEVVPAGSSIKPPHKRPTVVGGRRNSPKDMVLVDEKTGKQYRIYHPDAQADELNQARLAGQEIQEGWRNYRRTIPQKTITGARSEGQRRRVRRSMSRARKSARLRRQRKQAGYPDWAIKLMEYLK